ncbi:MAG: YidB family protein [Acidobacteriota bacterium]
MEVQMGLLDQFGGMKGVLGSLATTEAPAMIAAALAKTNMGSLQGIVDQLQQGGLGDQVRSWLGNGSNMGVTPEQIRDALGNDHVRQIAEQFGLPVDTVLNLLAEHLPATVDQASPDGSIGGS